MHILVYDFTKMAPLHNPREFDHPHVLTNILGVSAIATFTLSFVMTEWYTVLQTYCSLFTQLWLNLAFQLFSCCLIILQ